MPALRTLVTDDRPEAWERLGFTVADGSIRLGRVSITFSSESIRSGLTAWSIAGVPESIDGLGVAAERIEDGSRGFGDHHNGIFRVDRVTIYTDDLQRSVAAFELAELPQKQPGVFWAGRSIIELEERPADVAPVSGVATFGRLTLGTDDFERTAELLGSRLSSARPAPQRGQVIGTVSRDCGIAIPIDIVSPPPNAGIEQLAADARAGR